MATDSGCWLMGSAPNDGGAPAVWQQGGQTQEHEAPRRRLGHGRPEQHAVLVVGLCGVGVGPIVVRVAAQGHGEDVQNVGGRDGAFGVAGASGVLVVNVAAIEFRQAGRHRCFESPFRLAQVVVAYALKGLPAGPVQVGKRVQEPEGRVGGAELGIPNLTVVAPRGDVLVVVQAGRGFQTGTAIGAQQVAVVGGGQDRG